MSTPPPTRREPVVETLHGQSVADPYRWLEDDENEAVHAWAAKRDRFARRYFGRQPKTKQLVRDLEQLYYFDGEGAPVKRGNRWFVERRPKTKEKPIYFWREGEGPWQVLLDVNALSADGSVSVDGLSPSPDGTKLAYLVKANNADESTLRVMNVDDQALSKVDVIEKLRYADASWTPDGRGFFYTWLPSDPNIPPEERLAFAQIRYHRLGDAPSLDKTVREATGDAQSFLHAEVSKDGKYLFLAISRGWSAQDFYVMFLEDPNPDWQTITEGQKGRYQVIAFRDQFYVATDRKELRGEVYRVDPKRLQFEDWTRIVAEDSIRTLDDMQVVGGQLCLRYLKNATTELQLHQLDGTLLRPVALPGLGTASNLIGLPDQEEVYFRFSSFAQPISTYAYSVKTGRSEIYFAPEVPVREDEFKVEQVWFSSADGTRVSMFLMSLASHDAKTPARVRLYGYGGFNISLTPSYRPEIIPWLRGGGVFAMANLRGGGEYGEAWHRAGMGANKQNVFDDFIAASEWLIQEGYTVPELLAIEGGSNGGLLVGAAMTQRPDLFGAVVCAVPLLDMVRYPAYGIGPAWIPEYGDPAKAADFKILLQYSPYHQVQEGTHYPALLLLSADSDDRVHPMHARKFHAAIEQASSGSGPNLLRVETSAGHGGAGLRSKAVEKAADVLVFLFDALGTSSP